MERKVMISKMPICMYQQCAYVYDVINSDNVRSTVEQYPRTDLQNRKEKTNIRNFGNLIYRLKNGRVIMRPMAMMANGNSILRPAEVAMVVVAHMLEDKKNHPEYFEGIDFKAVLNRIIESYPELASQLSL